MISVTEDMQPQLERLFWLRSLLSLAMLVSLFIVVAIMEIPIDVWSTGLAPAGLIAFNSFVYWRLKKGWPASILETMGHLLIDSLAFTYFMYWTGGSANPFVSAYLVPVALAAVFGSLSYALVLGLASVGMYSFLMIYNVPLPAMNGRFGGDFSLHVVGMWLNYILSAAITVYFVSSLTKLARERDAALKQAEQESLNGQHMVALGALAAGAAHELGTPLSNISMLVDEINASIRASSPHQQNLTTETTAEIEQYSDTIKTQLYLCQSQISQLRDQAQFAQHQEWLPQNIDTLLGTIFDRFKAMRADLIVKIKHPAPSKNKMVSDPSLSQTLLNLLNNAADASLANHQEEIQIQYQILADTSLAIQQPILQIDINDFGTGMSQAQHARSGDIAFSDKPDGLGIGLLLSHANIKRLGGSLTLQNRKDSSVFQPGLHTQIRLPIHTPDQNSGISPSMDTHQ